MPVKASIASRFGTPVDLLGSGARTPELLAADPRVRDSDRLIQGLQKFGMAGPSGVNPFEASVEQVLDNSGELVPTHRIELWTPSLRSPETSASPMENQSDTDCPIPSDTGRK
jgi:hypothetical protein